VHDFCFNQSDENVEVGCGNFPISLKLQQQRCLIVGGGHIAYRKALLLVKAGAILMWLHLKLMKFQT
jgi:siroheme synthase (precorrin-2 oxidase/ferrochelatase)